MFNSTLKQLVVTAFDVFVLPSGIDAGTAHPLLPAEVDDVHIYPDHIGSQPADVASVIAGFNANITITLAHSALESADFAKDAKDEHGYGRRQLALDSTFRTCESALEKLPKELLIQGEANGGTALRDYSNGRINLDGDDDESSATARHAKLQERRRQQFDIQQINIHLGHLAAKLHALDRCRSLCERHGAAKALSPSNHAGPATPISARESDIEEAEFYKYLIKERERAVNESIAVLNGIETIAAELQISTTVSDLALILLTGNYLSAHV